MLLYQLDGAISDLNELISLSNEDINDIKEAKHEPQFNRLVLKDEKIKSFEQKKAMIDREISKLMTQNPSVNLDDLLDPQQHQKLDILKELLNKLRDTNHHYAKMVLSVGSFYNSLLEQLVPTQMQGYQKVTRKDASFLQVRA